MVESKEWKYSTIRPRPNSMYQWERPDHKLGYRKRKSLITTLCQWQPFCSCKWRSIKWYKARNDVSRREFISHVKSAPTQVELFTDH